MPQDRLTVDSGETYTVQGGDTEEWYGTTVNGTLDVDGTLELIDDPTAADDGPGQPGVSPIDLPLQIDLTDMNLGNAVFLSGFMALLLGAAGFLRNYIAIMMWGLALFALIASALLGIGLEVFWSLCLATILLLMIGAVVRWIN